MADTDRMPVTLEEVLSAAQFMRGFDRQWWVAGGWAIDLWLGRVTREHSDLEISVWREDQLALREFWHGWDWLTPRDREWVKWDGTFLELPEHQLMARREGREVEFFLNERADGEWVSRRDARIRVPEQKLVTVSERWDVPVIVPEVQLLYKAKYVRDKDRRDYACAIQRLGEGEKRWLKEALAMVHPGHEWGKFE